jgi:NAD(P)-dependent dehydrogenase (short-subunit alcohol dehydrogenase family)
MTDIKLSSGASWLGLEGRVCVVTGAGSGIGAETARQMAAAGASVAVLDRDAASAAEVAAQISRAGGRALSVTADIGDPNSVSMAAQQVLSELGPCRVLVNNAAIRHRQPLMEMDLQAWNRVLAVNLTGALVCTQAFAAQMIAAAHGGSLIHIASLIARYPQGGSGAYCASKGGTIALSRTLAIELGPHRIRSNVVSPGMVRTPTNEAAYRDPEIAAARQKMVPTGRVGDSIDLANVITFLASDRSDYINGEEITVDGGVNSTLMEASKRPLKWSSPS